MNHQTPPDSPNIDRRKFLQVFAALVGTQLAGCGGIELLTKSKDICSSPCSGDLVIDIHCHIMNVRDIDREAFIARRKANTDESNRWLNGLIEFGTSVFAFPHYLFVKKAAAEYHWLKANRTALQQSYQKFCDMAADEQSGLLFAESDDQIYGFGSNRARNAARLMALYPNVDIFTPSMVDLGEGNWKNYSSPYEIALCYEQINIASNGRFLPLVSFSPERAFIERTWENGDNGERQLELVKRCIENRGFIGVKVHPSSGFAPLNNIVNGCPNSAKQGMILSNERADFYNEQLAMLYAYCKSVDVPILTHSGTGISANRTCMEWNSTNSPRQWGEAIRQARLTPSADQAQTSRGNHDLRVCLAHFAGGFSPSGAPHPWLIQAADEMDRHDSLFIDLSALSEMFTKDKGKILDTYKKAFLLFLKQNPTLAQRMMYGSDWHMPGEAAIGDDYLPTIRSLIPQELQRQTMGLNAVKFLGLAKGNSNRARLECFYKANSVPLDKVQWIQKVDNATMKD